MIGGMPNHDRFECQTVIDSDAILQQTTSDGNADAAGHSGTPEAAHPRKMLPDGALFWFSGQPCVRR